MAGKWALIILVIVLALLELLNEILTRSRWWKRVARTITIAAAVGTVAVAVLQPVIEPPTSTSEVEGLKCSIDSLEKRVRALEMAGLPEPDTLKELRKYAECVAAAETLVTAKGSVLIAIGLGDYRAALSHIENALRAAGSTEERGSLFFYRGVSHQLLADATATHDSVGSAALGRQAVADYDSALAYKHDMHEGWYNRGSALDDLGRYPEAIASYDSALAYRHDLHEAWYNRGSALDDLGRYPEAIASYDSALAYKHDKYEAWNNRGSALDDLGRYPEAIASCDSALKYNPGDESSRKLREVLLKVLQASPP